MRKVFLTSLAFIFTLAYVATSGANMSEVGSPGWGTGPKIVWSSIVSFEDGKFIQYGWTRSASGGLIKLQIEFPQLDRKMTNDIHE